MTYRHSRSEMPRVLPAICLGIAIAFAPAAGSVAADAPAVRVVRVPDGGLQPQAVVDGGVLHLIYFRGKPDAGDVWYVRSRDGGATFSEPVRVNSEEGSAIAVGTIRGAHLAVGKGGRAHVAWMGSRLATPRAPGGDAPMLYTRAKEDGSGFEPQRNVIAARAGLDGGGSVAADGDGRVYVAWHAPGDGPAGESGRRVFVAASVDDGATFAAETSAFDEPTGACGCCGLRAFADRRGRVHVLYRGAREVVHRDMYLLSRLRPDHAFVGRKLHAWGVAKCVMSTAAIAIAPDGALLAWETEHDIWLARLRGDDLRPSAPQAVPGGTGSRKHPALAVDGAGVALVVWAEGTGWNRGGDVAWQVFDAEGRPVEAAAGRAEGLPVWSLPAACAGGDGRFVVLY